MKKIALLSTGGTIASKVDGNTGQFLSGEQTGEELLSKCNLKDLGDNVNVTVKSVLQVPSNHMTFKKNITLYEIMKQMVEEGYKGFVVTHGTDTLEESAYFMSLIWGYDVPIVFTGSQFSPTENNTDAYHNITNALLVASSDTSKGTGVLVSFNDRIFSAKYVTKTHASNIDGFSSPRTGPLGIADNGQVQYFNKPLKDKYYSLKDELPKVEIIKQYIDMDDSIIDHHIKNGVKGLVIEGYGRGHTKPSLVDKIGDALDKGIVVVVTTTCADGRVAPVYLFQGCLSELVSMGAINGSDYMPKKARIKLMVLLASGLKREEIKKEFAK